MKKHAFSRAFRLLLVLSILVLTMIGCMVTASADDMEWDLLAGTDAGYRAELHRFTKKTDEDGNVMVTHEAAPNGAALYVYDDNNIMGSYLTFSLEGDFYFDSFPSGTRDGKGPSDSPLSFLCWIYSSVESGKASVFNSIRLDGNGYLYTYSSQMVKSDVQLKTGQWYNIRCVFTPKNGISEVFVNGEKAFDFKITPYSNIKYKSYAVRYFDGYFEWGVKMKNLKVKTSSDYVIDLKREEAADYLAYQVTKPTGDTFSARAILGLNGTDFNRVGYETLLLTKDEDGFVTTESLSTKVKEVYETILDANGRSYNIKEMFDYEYAAALEIEDLPLYPDGDNFEIVIRPYVLGFDGIRRYGLAQTLYFIGEIDSDGYPVLHKNTGETISVVCEEDTYIWNDAQNKNTNYGTTDILWFKNPGDSNSASFRAAYFKFTLDAQTVTQLETAASAKLRVYIPNVFEYSGTRKLYDVIVHATDTDWSETGMTFQNHASQAGTRELIFQGSSEGAKTYFEADILTYLKEEMPNEDGSLTVSFRVTNEGHKDSAEWQINSRESSYTPVIEISNSIYEIATNLDKMNNAGYEPWGYAEYLVDEWFYGLRDEIYLTDAFGDPVYYEGIEDFAPNGYAATQPTGDFTEEVYWMNNNQWSTSQKDGYKKTENQWRSEKFARTLSTLGTSTANAFLSSSYADHIAEYDVYGGITNAGFTGEATGFFHVEKHSGRYYIIDPIGNPYFIMGMNDISVGSSVANQREYTLDTFGSEEGFFTDITAALQEIGVNSAFESTNEGLLAVEDGLACATRLNVLKYYMDSIGRASISEGKLPYNNTMNVFDPDFVKVSNKNVAAQIEKAGCVDDPRMIGYTSDNELPSESNMLSNYLTLNPAEEATNGFSYAVAWTWLARRMDVDYPTLADYLAAEDRAAMDEEFFCFVYATYYRVARDAIAAVDPNHMYMGSRVAGECKTNKGYLNAAGYYLDVLTVNLYDGLNPPAETISGIYKNSGKPFIVTEFFSQAYDAIDANGWMLGNSSGAGAFVKTQEERSRYYEHYVLSLIEAKSCVGWVWYRFRDCDQTLYRAAETGGDTVILLSVQSGTVPKHETYMYEDGTIKSADEVGKVDIIYEGNAINSNMNSNKGVYNVDYSSVVTVYQYDRNGKLLSSKGYEIKKPESEELADGDVVKTQKGSKSLTIGTVTNDDGTVTKTVLTVYEGKYVAFANSIHMISQHVIGLANYFDAQ